MVNSKRIFQLGRWDGPSLTYIESRQTILNEKISDAVLLVKAGATYEGDIFNNCAFVCENQVIANRFLNFGVHPHRVLIGGMVDALEYLAFAQRVGEL